MRRHLAFTCQGEQLIGTLDHAQGTAGLLIVSGGNELRSGAFAGQAQLATRIAHAGYPVFRFDRRGVGDSEGENGTFRNSAPDIAAALAAFRDHVPHIERVVAFGNCDAASALMLAGGASCDALALSNPWTLEGDAVETAPPRAIRAHYRQRLADPVAIRRLLSGKVSFAKLLGSLKAATAPPPPASSLAQEMAQAIEGFGGQVRFLVAERDRTGQAFQATWDTRDARIARCPDASHAYVETEARDWLFHQLVALLEELA